MFINQRYDGFTEDNQEAWRQLYAEQMAYLPDLASQVYAMLKRLASNRDGIPNIEQLNARLELRTGWNSVPVPGYIPAKAFFACLAAKVPHHIVIRPLERLDYLPEPDIFHDVFGHVPHADPVYGLRRRAIAALHATTDQQTEELARLFWFTVEFGLIQEDERLKVYGSGLIQAQASLDTLESPEVDRRPFDLEQVIATAFEIDHYQPILYVLDYLTIARSHALVRWPLAARLTTRCSGTDGRDLGLADVRCHGNQGRIDDHLDGCGWCFGISIVAASRRRHGLSFG